MSFYSIQIGDKSKEKNMKKQKNKVLEARKEKEEDERSDRTGKVEGKVIYKGQHLMAIENKENVNVVFYKTRTLEIFPHKIWRAVQQEFSDVEVE